MHLLSHSKVLYKEKSKKLHHTIIQKRERERERHNKTVDVCLFVLYKNKPVTVSWETWSIMRIEGSCTQVNNMRAGVWRGRRHVELLQPCPGQVNSTSEPTFYCALFNKCRLTASFLGSSLIVWSYLPHLFHLSFAASSPPESPTYWPSVRKRPLFSCRFITRKKIKIKKLQSVQCSKKKATIPVQSNAFHLLKCTLCLYGNSAAPTHSPLVSLVKWDPLVNMQHSQKREWSLILVLTVPN